MEKKNIAQAAFDALSVDVPHLKADYDNAKQSREDEQQFLKDNADVDLNFDPAEGPPTMPEQPAAATAGSGSGDAAGSGSGDAAGSGSGSDAGSGSGGSGSGGSGGSSPA